VDEHGTDLIVVQRLKLVHISVGLEADGRRAGDGCLNGILQNFRRDVANALVVVAGKEGYGQQTQKNPEKVLSGKNKDVHGVIISRRLQKTNSK